MNKPLSLRIDGIAQEVNSAVASITGTAAAWLAPVPEAAMTAQAITKIFGINGVLAVLVAASIELVGISVNAHLLESLAFNDSEERERVRRNRNSTVHPLEDTRGARAMVVGFYVTTGAIVAMTAIYEVAAEGAAWIKLLACLFPVASAIGTITMNRRAALHRKLTLIAQDAAQGAQAVTHMRAEQAQAAPQGAEAAAQPAHKPRAGKAQKKYVCAHCGEVCKSQQQYAAHMRYCNTQAADTESATAQAAAHTTSAAAQGVA